MFNRTNPIDQNKKNKFDSYLGRNTNWWDYYSQYKNIIDEIVTGIENNNIPIDTVSLPLLFLIRHCLELGLKANILKLEKVNKNMTKIQFNGSTNHSLEKLFDKFIDHLNMVKKNFKIENEVTVKIEEYLNEFESLKSKIHNLDQHSYNFRYPINTKGLPNFEFDTRENISEIINAFYKIQPFIIFTDCVLYEAGVTDLNRD